MKRILIAGILLTGAVFLIQCQSTSVPEENRDIFLALDMAVQKWKKFYDAGKVNQMKRMKQNVQSLARENRQLLRKTVREGPLDRRIVAAKTLHFLSLDRSLLETVLLALKDNDPRVQRNAASSLHFLHPSRKTYPDLLSKLRERIDSMMKSQNERVREAGYLGVQGLLQPGKDHGFFPLLIRGLGSSSVAVRNQSVRSLILIQDDDAVIPLIEQTLQDHSALVRMNTILALWSMEDKRSIPAMKSILKKKDTEDPEIILLAVKMLRDLTGLRELETPSEWLDWYRERDKKNEGEG